MRVTSLLAAAIFAASPHCVVAQSRVSPSDKLPPASIELKPNESPLPPKPWQLPKPGDLLYDAKKEAETKDAAHTHTVHVFERGIFKGYATLTSDPPPSKPAKEMRDAFTPNSKLPADAVELSASARPDKSDYFPTRPKTHPANIPSDCIPVRVFHRGQFIGWSFLPRDAVAALHKPEKT
jgi:hypothetical protein